MKKYTFTFYGKTTGAIGNAGKHTAARTAESEDAARLALYDEFEHVLVIKVDIEQPEALQA